MLGPACVGLVETQDHVVVLAATPAVKLAEIQSRVLASVPELRMALSNRKQLLENRSMMRIPSVRLVEMERRAAVFVLYHLALFRRVPSAPGAPAAKRVNNHYRVPAIVRYHRMTFLRCKELVDISSLK